ncbi:MAG: hypothetical protein KKD18_03555 [Nanoarchaeota archaeon]|nr:hypothetical protein [Nanoarchaeota archaeon]MBU0977466.1 hypothetical protein [Nanoarchaeota archaeon]
MGKRRRHEKPKIWDKDFISSTMDVFQKALKKQVPKVYLGKPREVWDPILSDFAGHTVSLLPVGFEAHDSSIKISAYFGYPSGHIVWHNLGGISGRLRPRGVRKYNDSLSDILFGGPCCFDSSIRYCRDMETALKLRNEIVRWADENTDPNSKDKEIMNRWFGADINAHYCALYMLRGFEVKDEKGHS